MSAKAGKRGVSITSEASNHTMVSEIAQEQPNGRASRPSKKGIAFGKRSNSMKRNPNAKVAKSGWLYKQASSGVKQWNKRWFVLVDRCLFYYKDEKEEIVQGSIPLLSFRITAVQPTDNVNKKHAFKAEHAGVRTYFFSADSQEEQEAWIQAMSEAAQVSVQVAPRNENTNLENIPPEEKNYVGNHKEKLKSDLETKMRGEGDGRMSEKAERKEEPREIKKEVLSKINGINTPEMTSEPGSPYPENWIPAGMEKGNLPNGWQYAAPNRSGSTAYPPQEVEHVHPRGFVPRTNPEKLAQRKSSMSQLQQWVNLRRGAPPPEEIRSPSRYYSFTRGTPDYYGPFPSPYPEGYQYYPPGMRPDSICSVPAYDRVLPRWTVEEKRRSLRDGTAYHLRGWKDQQGYARHEPPVWHPSMSGQPIYYEQMEAASNSLRRMSLQPQQRSRSVPRSPTQGDYSRGRMYSPVRSPSARFERVPRQEELYVDPAAYTIRRSVSSPKYEYSGERRPLPQVMYPYNYPASPAIHDKMVPPFPDGYRETLHPCKISESTVDKLLGQLCEQNKLVKDQEQLVQQLRIEKESLESALISTHQDIEVFGNQPGCPEKLSRKKETLQNQLINIRGELSQANTALASMRIELNSLENELTAIHNDLWEQLNIGTQSEMVLRQMQQELWRIQDVTEGLWKINPSRGTNTAKHKVPSGPSWTFTSNSPASPLSSNSLTSPMSPFSLISGSQGSPTKQGSTEASATISYQETKFNFEHGQKEAQRVVLVNPDETDASHFKQEHIKPEKQADFNKVGVITPRTKSPIENEVSSTSVFKRNSSGLSNGDLTRERPKSAVFSNEMKSKMSVQEQIHRMKRHQSGSMREKRRSLQLSANQQLDGGTSKSNKPYKVVRRHLSAHEVDISDLEAAMRAVDSNKNYESPSEEIARLRRTQIDPELYNIDFNKELGSPDKIILSERYIDLEPEELLSPEEMREKQKKLERIKTLIAKSSMQNMIPVLDGDTEGPADPETQLQEQEKRIEISCALAAEASRRSRLLSAMCVTPSPPISPTLPNPPLSSEHPPQVSDGSHFMCV
ncbi:pleckstrin homology domain-containing family A member 6 isoform X2 [Latimeria chalumnae]|uniref:pleckstrin homology domain-containing family A member 6 isoform X2 n=1 Tax=Latimeria chalumnae TaxID=7897 RepID=UPI0006D8EC10|nr:PREDICTED: pleckstrin homology domain-containing family A member 6 isoform X2 [Latimeria chalumnae]|eukprot:XP_014340109.1 PREDICTED: pleckstrin homology domain-containing family A member 6 isoform X2 [Latimeria chalumnae]